MDFGDRGAIAPHRVGACDSISSGGVGYLC